MLKIIEIYEEYRKGDFSRLEEGVFCIEKLQLDVVQCPQNVRILYIQSQFLFRLESDQYFKKLNFLLRHAYSADKEIYFLCVCDLLEYYMRNDLKIQATICLNMLNCISDSSLSQEKKIQKLQLNANFQNIYGDKNESAKIWVELSRHSTLSTNGDTLTQEEYDDFLIQNEKKINEGCIDIVECCCESARIYGEKKKDKDKCFQYCMKAVQKVQTSYQAQHFQSKFGTFISILNEQKIFEIRKVWKFDDIPLIGIKERALIYFNAKLFDIAIKEFETFRLSLQGTNINFYLEIELLAYLALSYFYNNNKCLSLERISEANEKVDIMINSSEKMTTEEVKLRHYDLYSFVRKCRVFLYFDTVSVENEYAFNFCQQTQSKILMEELMGMNKMEIQHLTLKSAQQKCGELKCTMLQYFVCEVDDNASEIYIWIIREDKVHSKWVKHPSLSKLIREGSDYLAGDILVPDGMNYKDFSIGYFSNLYEILVAPIEDQLPKNNPDELLVICPHDILLNVLFSALYSNKKKKYLIENHTLVLCHNLSIFCQKEIVTISDVDHSKIALVGIENFEGFPKELIDPEAEIEAKEEMIALSQILNTEPIIDPWKEKVLDLVRNSSLFHLVTHGLQDNLRDLGIPMYLNTTNLVIGGNGVNIDRFLTVEDIRSIKSNAKLIVLSCCNSGQGRLSLDGLINASRAFIISGACVVISPLFGVDCSIKSARNQMEIFYQKFKEGIDVIRSFRASQLHFLDQKTEETAELDEFNDLSQPICWANFSLWV